MLPRQKTLPQKHASFWFNEVWAGWQDECKTAPAHAHAACPRAIMTPCQKRTASTVCTARGTVPHQRRRHLKQSRDAEASQPSQAKDLCPEQLEQRHGDHEVRAKPQVGSRPALPQREWPLSAHRPPSTIQGSLVGCGMLGGPGVVHDPRSHQVDGSCQSGCRDSRHEACQGNPWALIVKRPDGAALKQLLGLLVGAHLAARHQRSAAAVGAHAAEEALHDALLRGESPDAREGVGRWRGATLEACHVDAPLHSASLCLQADLDDVEGIRQERPSEARDQAG
mmetsp:Transcript_2454/g.4951  ORF Transcript_2454/g.4951 Transcript_2454/m.4951 type:complete len:282 (-) Transcript_2454:442-1287(-)